MAQFSFFLIDTHSDESLSTLETIGLRLCKQLFSLAKNTPMTDQGKAEALSRKRLAV
jgi:hypothetical protein